MQLNLKIIGNSYYAVNEGQNGNIIIRRDENTDFDAIINPTAGTASMMGYDFDLEETDNDLFENYEPNLISGRPAYTGVYSSTSGSFIEVYENKGALSYRYNGIEQLASSDIESITFNSNKSFEYNSITYNLIESF